MEMEHVPHERPQYPIPARLVETELEVLRVQIQVRLERRHAEENLLGRVIGKLNSICTAPVTRWSPSQGRSEQGQEEQLRGMINWEFVKAMIDCRDIHKANKDR